MIQRYEMTEVVRGMESWHELHRDAAGDWCRWDEAHAEVERLRAALSDLVIDCERLGFAEVSVELCKPWVAARALLGQADLSTER